MRSNPIQIWNIKWLKSKIDSHNVVCGGYLSEIDGVTVYHQIEVLISVPILKASIKYQLLDPLIEDLLYINYLYILFNSNFITSYCYLFL